MNIYKVPIKEANQTPGNFSINPPPKKKYKIEVFEWEKVTEKEEERMVEKMIRNRKRNVKENVKFSVGEGRINRMIYNIEVDPNNKVRLNEIKDILIKQTIKEYNPLCKCFLRIYKNVNDIPKNIEQEYPDDTFLDDTIFNETNSIFIGIPKKQCTCGKLEDAKIRAMELKEQNDAFEIKKLI